MILHILLILVKIIFHLILDYFIQFQICDLVLADFRIF